MLGALAAAPGLMRAVKWIVIGLGLALLGAAGRLAYATLSELGELRRASAELVQVNADNARVANLHARDLRGQIEALERASDAAAARAAATAANMERVRHAEDSTACSASPAVRAALDGLRRKPRAAGAPGDDRPDHPGQPAGLSGAPGSSST